MITRRSLITTTTLLATLLVVPGLARATEEPAKKAEAKTEAAAKQADFLFVQNAQGIHYADGKLTLKGISPTTIMFTDRPERIAGHMTTTRFVPFWSEGKNSFLSDPPNATLSIVHEDKVNDVVVELRDPILKGDELSYTVRILEGEMPAMGGPVSLFIDIIGMPLTPLSYAGVARRTYRRAYYR
ncbi:MAG: hypothetical protein WBQ37_05930 [Candidatus Competibacter sp.]